MPGTSGVAARCRNINNNNNNNGDDPAPACREPDYLMFFDSDGNRREIRIPEGKYREVTEHYRKGEWENLSAYPAWGES
ncbi:hypothetical protein VTN96DRAFT_839 [Rasamsonia emersonii]